MYEKTEYAVADDELKEIYNDIIEYLGNEGLVDYFKVLGKYNPSVLKATWALLKSVLIQGELPRSLKELVFIAISREKDCKYCTEIHTALCKILNVDDVTIQKVLTRSKDINPRKMQLAIDFSIKVALHSNEVTEEDHKKLMSAGMRESEIFELMSLASVVNYSNTLSQAMMIGVDDEVKDFLLSSISD